MLNNWYHALSFTKEIHTIIYALHALIITPMRQHIIEKAVWCTKFPPMWSLGEGFIVHIFTLHSKRLFSWFESMIFRSHGSNFIIAPKLPFEITYNRSKKKIHVPCIISIRPWPLPIANLFPHHVTNVRS